MGGNLASWAGPPEATLAAAAARLESLGRVTRRSSLYSTEPVGFAEQPRFVNAVVALETEREPQDLLSGLLSIEQEFGRDRSAGIANGPRTLDLDILLFGEMKICEPAPGLVDATSGRTMSQLLDSLSKVSESGTNAVFPIQSDAWHAHAGLGGASPDTT
jgi:2-amino-4-hydroxy-6-hydroxymethyldihydropteridine diphosphokinase